MKASLVLCLILLGWCAAEEERPADVYEHQYKRDLYNLQATLNVPECKAAQAKCEADPLKTGKSIPCKKGQRKVAVLSALKGSKCDKPVCTEYQCIYTDCSKVPEGFSLTSTTLKCDACTAPKPVMDCGCKFFKCLREECKKIEMPTCPCHQALKITENKCGCIEGSCAPKPNPVPCNAGDTCKSTCEECKATRVFGKDCPKLEKSCTPKKCPPVTCKPCEKLVKSECGCSVCVALPPNPTPVPCGKCEVPKCRPHDDAPNCKEHQICDTCVPKIRPVVPCNDCQIPMTGEDECGPTLRCLTPATPTPVTCKEECEDLKCTPNPQLPKCKASQVCECIPKSFPTPPTCTDCEKAELVSSKCDGLHKEIKCVPKCLPSCNQTKCDLIHGKGKAKCGTFPKPKGTPEKCTRAKICHRCLLGSCEQTCITAARPPGPKPKCPVCMDSKLNTIIKSCGIDLCDHITVPESRWGACTSKKCAAPPKCDGKCNTKATKTGEDQCKCPIYKCLPPKCPLECEKCHECKQVEKPGCDASIGKCVPKQCPKQPNGCYTTKIKEGTKIAATDACGCPSWEQKPCPEARDVPGMNCTKQDPKFPCPKKAIDTCGCPAKICETCPSVTKPKCNDCEVLTTKDAKCDGKCVTKECTKKPCPVQNRKACGTCEISVSVLNKCNCKLFVCKQQPCQPIPKCPGGKQQVIEHKAGDCCPCFMGCRDYTGPTTSPGGEVPPHNTTIKPCEKNQVCKNPNTYKVCEKCVKP